MIRDRLPRSRLTSVASIVLALSVAGTSGVAADRPAEVDPDLAAKLQVRLDRWRVNHRAPGVAAAIRLPDGSHWVGTSGTKTVGRSAQLVQPGTPFAVASLTKTFVAALILQLSEEDKLKLGDPLSKWLPKYPRANKITIRMLLGHRSGIFDYFDHLNYERKVFGRPTTAW